MAAFSFSGIDSTPLTMSAPTNNLLLHCCCAPCTLLPLESLTDEGWRVALYYYNPNIHPFEEYEKRLSVMQELASSSQVVLHVGAYDVDAWEERVGIGGGPYPLIPNAGDFAEMEAAKKLRCAACYALRFEALAAHALTMNIERLDTTLTISPYQFTQQVAQELAASALKYRGEALASDWRRLYPEATKKSRALGMYRQNYCGCRFSFEEARLERLARKEARATAKKEKL